MAPLFSHVITIEQQLDSSSGWSTDAPSGYHRLDIQHLFSVYIPQDTKSQIILLNLQNKVLIVTTAPDNPANRRVSANIIAPNHTMEARLGPTGYAATLSYSNDVGRVDHHVE
jgi:hypothetical protein